MMPSILYTGGYVRAKRFLYTIRRVGNRKSGNGRKIVRPGRVPLWEKGIR